MKNFMKIIGLKFDTLEELDIVHDTLFPVVFYKIPLYDIGKISFREDHYGMQINNKEYLTQTWN